MEKLVNFAFDAVPMLTKKVIMTFRKLMLETSFKIFLRLEVLFIVYTSKKKFKTQFSTIKKFLNIYKSKSTFLCEKVIPVEKITFKAAHKKKFLMKASKCFP